MARFLIVVLVACGSARPLVQPSGAGTCEPAIVSAPRLAPATGSVDDFVGQQVSKVELVGVPVGLHGEIAAKLEVKADVPLDRDAVRRDLVALEKLEIADDIVLVAEPDGDRVAIRFELAPRGRLERVTIHGLEHRSLALLRGLVGTLDNPRRIESVTRHLEAQFRAEGYLDAKLASTYVARGHVCTAGSLGRRYTIDRIDVTGGDAIPMAELRRRFARRITVNTIGGPYQKALLGVVDEYRERGYSDAGIATPQVTVDRERARIAIRIAVTQGKRFELDRIEWRGPVEPAGRAAFGLERGAIFSPDIVHAAAARLRAWAHPRNLSISIDNTVHQQHGRVDLIISVTKDTIVR